MIGVDEARARILSRFHPLDRVDVPLLEAAGMVVAEDIVARSNVPPFRNSAMDGYAVRAEDAGNVPVTLRVIGNVAAGAVSDRPLAAGEAMRIMTGAPIPDGADAVVRFEETDEADLPTALPRRTHVVIRKAPLPGENVREAGEDVPSGVVAIRRGAVLGPAEVGILASLNVSAVPVHRRPIVGILATGDEVTDLGPPLVAGQIRNSNSYILAALVRRYGGEPLMLGIARDSANDLRDGLDRAGKADMLVTSGGVSIGDFDVVKDVLQSEGAIDIWQVRMKPGKPLAFGVLNSTPLLGLPGNPVAALVSFEQFGRPALLKMLGRVDIEMPSVTATIACELTNRGGRRHFVRGVLELDGPGFRVRPVGDQGSAVLTSVVRSNCLIVVPETMELVHAGSSVEVQIPDPATFFASVGRWAPSSR